MRAALFLTVFLASPAAAQEAALALQKTLEMPAHRSLISRMEGETPKPFETDGCSGGLSSSWRVVADLFPDFADVHEDIPPWESCCVIHDRAYHNSGGASTAEASFDARLVADDALHACVIAEGQTRREDLAQRYDVAPEMIDRAYVAVADAMFTAVRFGGGPCSGLPWRWGFGYPNCPLATLP